MNAHPSSFRLRWIASLSSALLALASVSSLSAAALYWDVNGDPADATYGGTGTWDGTNTFWNNSSSIGGGTTLSAWNNSASPLDTANFLRGTTGTVTVSGTQAVLALNFSGNTGSFTTGTSAYTLTGGVIDIRQASFSNTISNTGNNTVESDIHLFGNVASATEGNRQRLVNNSGTLTLTNIQNISTFSGTGVQSISLESYSAALNINGNITKGVSSDGSELLVGGAGTNGGSNYSLGGNNTGLTGVATVNRGTLTLNNSNALVGASSVTIANANTTVALADTANLLIGAGGVSINKAITFAALTATDTSDIRAINTSGTATYSGTVTLGAFAASGTGSSLRVTSASGGTVVFSGNITDSTASVALLLNGTGIVKFTRAAGMNYDGGTTVSSGTFLVNNTTGSGTGTGVVSVSTGATFGGSGISSGAITLAAGGRLAPGNMDETGVSSAGTFTGGSSLTWNSDNTAAGLFFNLGADQASSDQLALAGAFTKGSGSTFVFDFTGSTPNASIAYTLVTFGSTDFAAGDFSAINGGTGEFALIGNTLVFGNLSSIPEPSAYAALFGAFALAACVSRRRAASIR
jgi:hypothetical protein